MRFRKRWTCGAALALMVAVGTAATAADSPAEVKELDKLQGYDSLKGEKSLKGEMEAAPNQPVESIIVWSEAAPTSGKAPLKVTFTADPPTGIEKPQYSWHFGDGDANASGVKVSHTYSKPGVYRVLLKVTNAKGALGEDELRIKVTP
ncbi:MAG: PKD domain-containing protein [Deltaproteobacteria bacterium]|nr:PKD domain-containing protein [Deltaproteobacteria bacterium]